MKSPLFYSSRDILTSHMTLLRHWHPYKYCLSLADNSSYLHTESKSRSTVKNELILSLNYKNPHKDHSHQTIHDHQIRESKIKSTHRRPISNRVFLDLQKVHESVIQREMMVVIKKTKKRWWPIQTAVHHSTADNYSHKNSQSSSNPH